MPPPGQAAGETRGSSSYGRTSFVFRWSDRRAHRHGTPGGWTDNRTPLHPVSECVGFIIHRIRYDAENAPSPIPDRCERSVGKSDARRMPEVVPVEARLRAVVVSSCPSFRISGSHLFGPN